MSRPVRRAKQIAGRERARIAQDLRERYEQGASIRDLAGETGRSFGWIRTLLQESGAQLRGRGGDHSAPPRWAPSLRDLRWHYVPRGGQRGVVFAECGHWMGLGQLRSSTAPAEGGQVCGACVQHESAEEGDGDE